MDNPVLSLIIPTLNEQDLILGTLNSIELNLGPELSKKTQIIIVDDGMDDLPDVVSSHSNHNFHAIFVLRNKTRLGKGKSISNGFSAAQADIVGFIDADLSISPAHIGNAYSLLVNSSNYGLIGERNTPRFKRLNPVSAMLSGVFSLIINVVFFEKNKFRDTQCGFKFFKRDIARELYADLVATDGLADAEALIKAHKKGYEIMKYSVVAHNIRKSKRPLRKILFKEISSLCKIFSKHL